MTNKEKELMRLYGEFLTRFEFVCSRLRFAMCYLVYDDYDLSKRNICEIITEGLTADPLRKKLLGLVVERFSKPSDMYKSAELFSKHFSEIIELRNSFAHGTPFFGQYDFIEETKRARLALRHPKIKSDGLDLNFKIFDSKKLKSLIACIKLMENSIGILIVLLKHRDLKEDPKKKFHDKIINYYKLINIKDLLKD